MTRRILVALDGSPTAESALPYAESLARLSDATLVLIQVALAGEALEALDTDHPNVLRYSPPAPTGPTDPHVAHRLLSESREYLNALADDLRGREITVTTAVVSGDPGEVLVEQATLRHADMLVMSTHGRSGVGRLLYGSVAESVIVRSAIPILLVRAGSPRFALPSIGTQVRLLVSLDGSPSAEKALPFATDLTRALKAELVLARIIPTAGGETRHSIANSPSHASASPDADAATYLDTIATRLRADGTRVSTAVRWDNPPAGIISIAEATDSSFIVMATHGRTGIGRAILGSVALEVVRQGRRPVLLVRSGTNESA